MRVSERTGSLRHSVTRSTRAVRSVPRSQRIAALLLEKLLRGFAGGIDFAVNEETASVGAPGAFKLPSDLMALARELRPFRGLSEFCPSQNWPCSSRNVRKREWPRRPVQVFMSVNSAMSYQHSAAASPATINWTATSMSPPASRRGRRQRQLPTIDRGSDGGR